MKRLISLKIILFYTLIIWTGLNINGIAREATLQNGMFTVRFDTESGKWNCNTVNGDNIINNAELLIITEDEKRYFSSSPEYTKTVKKNLVADKLGSGEKLEIQLNSSNHAIPDIFISFILYNEKSFFTVEAGIKNSGKEIISIREIQVVNGKNQGSLQFKGAVNDISCLIDGYDPGHESQLISFEKQSGISGYTTTALYNMSSKESLIIGALSNKKAISLIAMQLQDKQKAGYSAFDLTLSAYFGYNYLQPGESVSSGPVMIDMPENVFAGLENYAQNVADYNGIVLDKKPLSGWCSWYYMYPDITEKEVLLNVEFLKNNLKDYGLEYIQVDRGRAKTGTDWLTTNSKFPHDMKWLAGQIHEAGFKAGIWTAPYWLGRDSKFYNPDWIIEKISEKPKQESGRRRHWASWGDMLDASNKEVTDYMKSFVSTLVDEWDYDYLKNDFLIFGFPEIEDIDKALLENGEVGKIKKFPRKNKNITPVEAYQNGVKAIKKTAGDNTFIMGCGAPLFYSAGFVDAARVGGDIQSKLCVSWECGTSKTVRTSAKRYYYNGKILWIDPDCLVTWDPCGRGPFTFEQAKARATMASFFGGMIMLSDKTYELPPERIDLLKRVFPVHPKSARPVDLFEKDMPEIWLWDIQKDFDNWHVLGVFNYDNEPMNREISYAYLGLDTTKQYIVYDFWNKKMPTRSSRYNFRSLMPFDKEIALEVSPQSCKVIAIHEKLTHPQVLSTNRHLTQGAIDLENVTWDEKSQTLSGISKLVKNDDYELIITLPENLSFVKAETSNLEVVCSAWLDDPDVDRYNTVRVHMKSPENQKVNWSVAFNK